MFLHYLDEMKNVCLKRRTRFAVGKRWEGTLIIGTEDRVEVLPFAAACLKRLQTAKEEKKTHPDELNRSAHVLRSTRRREAA
jgi:hypothetical protein